MDYRFDVAIVGGCGHVGLPLGLAFADSGLKVALYDIDENSVAAVNAGFPPFSEPGASEVLARNLAAGRIAATNASAVVRDAEHVVLAIGTPVDEHQNPALEAVRRAVGDVATELRNGQLLVLRSTVYPGVTAMVDRFVSTLDLNVDVAFCPERIAEGKALSELRTLPQIVSGCSQRAQDRAGKLFGLLTGDVVFLAPEEAELAKLFTNAWRYMRFAAANQLFMIANDYGLDYERIRSAVSYKYPRAADLPSAGFTAGPCLMKDTMQLAAFNNNNFPLGQAAIAINEGLPLYLVAKLEHSNDLSRMTVGILGMAFKGESDDVRSSLSYKLKRILRFKAAEVLCTDPYVTVDPELLPLDKVLADSDVLIVAAPHREYARLDTRVPVVDVWNICGRGARA